MSKICDKERSKRKDIYDLAQKIKPGTDPMFFGGDDCMGFSYDKALIGYAVSKEGYVVSVYSQELMIQEMGEIDGLSEEDALDWIGFNDMTIYRFDGPIVITSQCEQMLDEKLEPGIIGFVYDENMEPIPVFQEGNCSYNFWESGPEKLIVKLFKVSEKLVKDTILT